MKRCLGKGKNINSGIALVKRVPYFVCLSCNHRLSLPTATAPRLCAVGCVGCVNMINMPTGIGNP